MTSLWTCWRSLELLVEMARQQQRRVVLFALGDLERALAELHGEVGGAERNRDHEGDAAQDQPLNRAELNRDSTPAIDPRKLPAMTP